jgi:hypothetical protein
VSQLSDTATSPADIAARMPTGEGQPPEEQDDYLIEELVEEFRQIPDEWKEEAVRQVAMLRRLSERPLAPTARGEGDGADEQDPPA